MSGTELLTPEQRNLLNIRSQSTPLHTQQRYYLLQLDAQSALGSCESVMTRIDGLELQLLWIWNIR